MFLCLFSTLLNIIFTLWSNKKKMRCFFFCGNNNNKPMKRIIVIIITNELIHWAWSKDKIDLAMSVRASSQTPHHYYNCKWSFFFYIPKRLCSLMNFHSAKSYDLAHNKISSLVLLQFEWAAVCWTLFLMKLLREHWIVCYFTDQSQAQNWNININPSSWLDPTRST